MDLTRRNGRKSEQGITVVELIVVIAVIAILSTLSASITLQWLQNADNRSSARQIISILRETRSKAIVSNLEHRVTFDEVHKRFHVVRGNRHIDSTEWTTVVYDGISLPSNVHVIANRDYIHINTNGTANAGTISILNDAGEKLFNITIASTGRIRLWT